MKEIITSALRGEVLCFENSKMQSADCLSAREAPGPPDWLNLTRYVELATYQHREISGIQYQFHESISLIIVIETRSFTRTLFSPTSQGNYAKRTEKQVHCTNLASGERKRNGRARPFNAHGPTGRIAVPNRSLRHHQRWNPNCLLFKIFPITAESTPMSATRAATFLRILQIWNFGDVDDVNATVIVFWQTLNNLLTISRNFA